MTNEAEEMRKAARRLFFEAKKADEKNARATAVKNETAFDAGLEMSIDLMKGYCDYISAEAADSEHKLVRLARQKRARHVSTAVELCAFQIFNCRLTSRIKPVSEACAGHREMARKYLDTLGKEVSP